MIAIAFLTESMLPRSVYSAGSAQSPPTSSVLGLLWTTRGPDSHESQQGPFPLLSECPTSSIIGSGWWSNLLKPNSETHGINNFLWSLVKYVGCYGANTFDLYLAKIWCSALGRRNVSRKDIGVWFSLCCYKQENVHLPWQNQRLVCAGINTSNTHSH